MNAKTLFGLGLALFVIVAEVSGRSCSTCGLDAGVDACGCDVDIFRPVAVPCPKLSSRSKVVCSKIESGVEDYRPVGDVCSCRGVKPLPAVLPKPKLWQQCTKPQKCDNRPLIPAPAYMHDFGQDEEDLVDSTVIDENACGPQKPLFPVDAVSIDLVNRMQQTAMNAVPEEKLQYGFSRLPSEQPMQKVVGNVPEERLYTVDRQIVELKNPRQVVNCGNGPDEEIIVQDSNPAPIAYLSYRDLGFVPESGSNGNFRVACNEGRKHYRRPEVVYDDEYVVRRGSDEIVKYIDSEEYDIPCKVNRDGVFIKKLGGGCGC